MKNLSFVCQFNDKKFCYLSGYYNHFFFALFYKSHIEKINFVKCDVWHNEISSFFEGSIHFDIMVSKSLYWTNAGFDQVNNIIPQFFSMCRVPYIRKYNTSDYVKKLFVHSLVYR